MFDFENDFDYEWTESAKGFVLHEDGEILATVFSNKFLIWMIIINQDEGGRLVADEYFDNATQAIKRANSIMAGAPCKYAPEPASGVSGRVKQVRISAIVDTCFRLIVDGVSEPSWTRRGCAQARG